MSEPKLGPTPAQITMMGHNIHAQIAVTRRKRRRTRALLAGVGVAVIVGGSITAAALAVRPAPDEQVRYLVDCYATDAVVADESDRVIFLPGEDDEVPFGSEYALMQCARSYERRLIDAPDPTVCELADLRLGVFPNVEGTPQEEFCVALGLHAPDY